ncbi:hypothetical protein RJ640_021240 [Escallonia rubra]|uniref:RNase H type-1 domain-containing protein n=1 Tax=Escallonia rubra TaxID=112253 RepID=A0AA88U7N7_9ASTE|nr:hypothetical protein RJ640_021240 [Escallonia rubra]
MDSSTDLHTSEMWFRDVRCKGLSMLSFILLQFKKLARKQEGKRAALDLKKKQWNEVGLFLVAKAIHFSHCLNARTAAALAPPEALNLASEMHLSHIIIEGDSYYVIKLIDTNQPLPPDIEVIVLDCRRLKQQFQEICFSFSPRMGNRSAHMVANHSRPNNGTTTWTSCPPS